jgi:hypothetical protein
LTFHANTKDNNLLKRFPFILKFIEMIAQWRIDGIIGVAPLTLEPFKGYKGPKLLFPME